MGIPQGLTLSESAHPFTFAISEDSDGSGYLSRDEVLIANTMINARATVRLADLSFNASATQAQIDQAQRDLGANLIKFR